MYENKEKQQTALLAAVDTGEFDVQRSVDELEELAKSAGAGTGAAEESGKRTGCCGHRPNHADSGYLCSAR